MKTIFAAIILCILTATGTTSSAQTGTDSVLKTVVKVTNLHCDGDMPAIKKRLLNQDGIDEVSFSDRAGTASTFTVTYHSAATNETRIDAAIESTPGCDDQTETPYRVKRAKSKR